MLLHKVLSVCYLHAEPLAKLMDISSLEISFPVPESEIRQITEGMEVGVYGLAVINKDEFPTFEIKEGQKMLDNLEKDVNAAVSAGIATETDRLQLRLKQNELKATRTKLKGGIRLAKMNLCNSIGVAYSPYSTMASDTLPYIDSIVLADDLGSLEEPASCWRDEKVILAGREESRLLDISVKAKQMEKKMALRQSADALVDARIAYRNAYVRYSSL